jgi:hypothetical protein
MEYLLTAPWSVSQLIDNFFEGRIAIPEIQRDLVWSSDQVKSLLDSIYQSFPCGSLILWEPRDRDAKLMREIIRPERLEYYKGKIPRYFLIDGQQRVTALASVMLKPGFLKEVEPEIENDLGSLYVNIKKFPKEIEAATDGEPYKFPWVSVNDVFTGRIKELGEFEKLTYEQKRAIDRDVQRIRDYTFPVQIIQERNYPTVAKIFTLVNSQGTQLTGAEIYVASIIPYWRGIAAEFRRYRRDLRSEGYDLDLTFLMRSITVITTDVPQIKKLADRVARRDLTQAQLNRLWAESKRAMNRVIATLKDELYLDKTKFFASKNALVPLVYFAAKARGKRLDRKAMLKYFIVSQLGGHYSGAGETVLRRDLRYLSEPDVRPAKGLRGLLEVVIGEAKQQYRGLKLRHDQIGGVPSKNVILLLMYIVMRKREATDFGIPEGVTLDQISTKDLQLHHIFPFDFMMRDPKAKEYQERKMLSPWEYREEVNDVANITFIGQRKNAQIGNVSPWQYLKNETTKQMRKAHFIPEDRELWRPENYGKFLDRRRKLLAKAINSLIRALH